jgi:choline dehydrogenase-like flavoprotein
LIIEEVSSDQQIWDLCIVGTGPVGMAMALEFERLGRDVLVLESGGSEVSPALAEASRAEIMDPARHAAMEIAVCRALGGTSWTWGGRCVPYDDIDWTSREFVADAHWPVGHDELRPWYKGASEYLLCGSDTFAIPYDRKLRDGLTLDSVERWARESRVILEHRDRLLRSERIKLSLNSTVTGLNLSQDGQRVESLSVTSSGHTRTVKVARVILAMGGVETTRLLLRTQQRWPDHFGGTDGPLGRYYMGHISGKIASITLNDPRDIEGLDFTLDRSGAYYRRRFMLTAEAQLKHSVLNIAFWPDNPAFYDPGHGSGVLSSVFLLLAFPPAGRRLVSEGIRLAHTGPKPYRLGAHLRNAVLGGPRAVGDFYKILRDRFVRMPKKPGFLVHNRGGKYALHYHAEQVPNPDSRITLTNETDCFGVPRASIDLRFVDQDVESVITSHAVLDEALQANGIGRLQYMYAPEQLRERIFAQASDGFHQVGSTRMGTDPRTSVVDPSLRAHGVENLFVASSSVFPTSGQANSTLLAVAFALRLSSYLCAANVGAESRDRHDDLSRSYNYARTDHSFNQRWPV